MCVSGSAALALVVFGLIVVDHAVEVGRCRCSGHLNDRPAKVGRQRRFAVQALEDIHGASSRQSGGFLSSRSQYAVHRAIIGVIERAIFSRVMMRVLVSHDGDTEVDLLRR